MNSILSICPSNAFKEVEKYILHKYIFLKGIKWHNISGYGRVIGSSDEETVPKAWKGITLGKNLTFLYIL